MCYTVNTERKERMKLIFLSTLLIRFSRVKIKKIKKQVKVALGDNYPVIPINKLSFKP